MKLWDWNFFYQPIKWILEDYWVILSVRKGRNLLAGLMDGVCSLLTECWTSYKHSNYPSWSCYGRLPIWIWKIWQACPKPKYLIRTRYVVLGFGGERAGVTVRAIIDHMPCLQFKRLEDKEHPQPKNNENPQIDPTHMLDFALNSSWSRSWTFVTRLLWSA